MADETGPFPPQQILSEFRQKYPDYADRTDQELAQALTVKYPDSYGKIFSGFLQQRPAQMPQAPATSYPLSEAAGDVGKGALRVGLPAIGATLGMGVGGPAGAMAFGAGGDLIAKKLTGDTTPMGPGEMAASGVTSLFGGLPAKGAGMLARPVSQESQLVMGQAARLGIPLNAAENTGRAGLAQSYANLGRYPSSATRVEQFGTERRAAIQQAGESIAQPRDLVQAGEGVARRIGAVQTGQEQAAEEAVNRFTTSLGKPAEREAFGTEFQKTVWEFNRQRRARASQLYDHAENTLGDLASPAATLNGVAGGMAQKEARLQGVRNPTLGRTAGGLESATAADASATVNVRGMPPEQVSDLIRMGGGGVGGSPAVSDLPTEFVKLYKLDQPRNMTFSEMRDIQSRLSGMIQKSHDDYTKNKLGDLHDAITNDIKLLANNTPGAEYLHQANNFYKKEVAGYFGRRTPMRGLLDESQVDRVTDKLMNADSPAMVRQVMEVLSPRPGLGLPRNQGATISGANLQDTYRASFMNRLHDEGLNPATGQWDPARYLRATDRYSDDTLKAVLGPKFNEFAKVRSTLQRDLQPTSREPLYSTLAKADEAQIPGRLLTFVKNNNHEDVQAVLSTLGPNADAAKEAMWTEFMRKSASPDTKQFSIQRFMNQTKELDPRTREILLGPAGAQKLGEFENVLRRIQTVGSFGMNPSESARGILGAGQMEHGFRLALQTLSGKGNLGGGKLATAAGAGVLGTMVGGPGLGTTAAAAVITDGLLRPNVMSKFLLSERGIDLLTRGLTVSPGTKQAITLASELAAFGAKNGLSDQ